VVAIAGAVGGVATQLPSRLGSSRFPRPGSAPGADLAAVVAGSAPVFSPPTDARAKISSRADRPGAVRAVLGGDLGGRYRRRGRGHEV